jgi:heptosyltransferase II
MKILLVQTSFLGDTILSTPVIAGIKTLHPDAELWMLTTPLASELVRRDPLLRGVLVFDKRGAHSGLTGLLRLARELRSMRFDKVYSLHRSYRTSLLLFASRIPSRVGFSDAGLGLLYTERRTRDMGRHDVERNMTILQGELASEPEKMKMRLFAPPASELSPKVKDALPPPGTYAVLLPGSAWRTKMWHWEGYRGITRFLLDRRVGVVLLGSNSDRQVSAKVAEQLDVVDLTGRTSIAETMHIVKNARLVVCNDSMALHMASAFHVPTAVFFCATSPRYGYGPWQNRAVVVEAENLSCKPCRPHGSVKCPNGTEACLRSPEINEVTGCIGRLLEER